MRSYPFPLPRGLPLYHSAALFRKAKPFRGRFNTETSRDLTFVPVRYGKMENLVLLFNLINAILPQPTMEKSLAFELAAPALLPINYLYNVQYHAENGCSA